jgi:hypothetical protein
MAPGTGSRCVRADRLVKGNWPGNRREPLVQARNERLLLVRVTLSLRAIWPRISEPADAAFGGPFECALLLDVRVPPWGNFPSLHQAPLSPLWVETPFA